MSHGCGSCGVSVTDRALARGRQVRRRRVPGNRAGTTHDSVSLGLRSPDLAPAGVPRCRYSCSRGPQPSSGRVAHGAGALVSATAGASSVAIGTAGVPSRSSLQKSHTHVTRCWSATVTAARFAGIASSGPGRLAARTANHSSQLTWSKCGALLRSARRPQHRAMTLLVAPSSRSRSFRCTERCRHQGGALSSSARSIVAARSVVVVYDG
jgi:hypothetical protein